MNYSTLVLGRIRESLRRLPTRSELATTVVTLAAFGLVCVPFGLATGLLQWTGPADSVRVLAPYLVVAFVLPSLMEEMIFRVALLPHPLERVPRNVLARQCLFALVLFILWHPLNAWLFVPWARPLFFRADFLAAAGLLGAAATVLYLRSGSVWPSVLFHWAVVVAWKTMFGGRVITFGPPPS
jgi:predicted Abi (CAAX) family protease